MIIITKIMRLIINRRKERILAKENIFQNHKKGHLDYFLIITIIITSAPLILKEYLRYNIIKNSKNTTCKK